MNLKVLCFADLSVLYDLSFSATCMLSNRPGTSLCTAMPKTGKVTKVLVSNGRAVKHNNIRQGSESTKWTMLQNVWL